MFKVKPEVCTMKNLIFSSLMDRFFLLSKKYVTSHRFIYLLHYPQNYVSRDPQVFAMIKFTFWDFIFMHFQEPGY